MLSLKILVVEDQAITAMFIKQTLEDAGHGVTGIARNFDEAVALVKKDPPDIGLLDIELKGSSRDGIGTAKEITQLHTMPIVYLTSHTETDIYNQAKDTFPSAYLQKPFVRSELLMQIDLAYHNFSQQKSANMIPYESDSLFLKIKKVYEKIPKSAIKFLEADSVYTHLHLAGRAGTVTVTIGLGLLAPYLPDSNFFKLSRSFLINLDFVEKLDNNYIYLRDSIKPIAIPQGKKKELMIKLNVIRGK
jgi:DNA-binding LytR/AlgR family response regulator